MSSSLAPMWRRDENGTIDSPCRFKTVGLRALNQGLWYSILPELQNADSVLTMKVFL